MITYSYLLKSNANTWPSIERCWLDINKIIYQFQQTRKAEYVDRTYRVQWESTILILFHGSRSELLRFQWKNQKDQRNNNVVFTTLGFFFQNIYHVTLHSFFFILVYARLQFQQSAKVCLHALKTQNAQRDLGTAGKLQTSVLMTERSKDNIPLLEVQLIYNRFNKETFCI